MRAEWSPGAAGPVLSLLDDEGLPALWPSWMGFAACAEVGDDFWFPEKGGSSKAAKSVCMRCEVRGACLDYALDERIPHGIWGAKSERERREILRERREHEAILAAGEKICTGCHEVKPLDGPHGFYPLRGWYEPQCKDCRRRAVADWAKRNKAA